jgi:Flp pilus assembly protein TadD
MPRDERVARAAELSRTGRFAEAEAVCRGVLIEDPQKAAAVHTLGLAVYRNGKAANAVELLNRAITIDPSVPDFFGNFGCVLGDMGLCAEAAEMLERAIALKPQYAEAHHNLGTQRLLQGQLEGAEKAFRAASTLRPDWVAPQVGLFRALGGLDRPFEAAEVACGLTRTSPTDPSMWRHLAAALQAAARPGEAVAALKAALRLGDNDPRIHLDLALALLQLGDFESGWEEYEWRWKCAEFKERLRAFEQPLWDGSSLENKTILLWADQGLGSTIQLARYAELLATHGAKVILECQPQLKTLLRDLCGVTAIVGRDEQLPPFDVHSPLMSLPLLTRTNAKNIPAKVPYLSADSNLVEHWRRRLANISGQRIGIAWQGNPNYARDRVRSVQLSQFTPLTRLDGIHLVTLQKGPGAEQTVPWLAGLSGGERARVVDLAPGLDTPAQQFVDAAAVMMSLDLIITVDTSIAHLAGALGRDVWLALNFASDWKWLYGREDSPWYPNMRLFRQRAPGDWPGVFEAIAGALRARIEARRVEVGFHPS